MIMGGQAPAAMRAAIAYCDGCMPTVRSEAFFAKLGEFRELLAQSGREPKTLAIGAYYEPAGKLDQDRRALARFADAGVDYVSSSRSVTAGRAWRSRKSARASDVDEVFGYLRFEGPKQIQIIPLSASGLT
jgi:hypothetical protein